MSNFMWFCFIFGPNLMNAVVMAMEVEMNKLSLVFLFLNDHKHCKQVLSNLTEHEVVHYN